ncbi:MAG: 30S ribosomal protein S4 [Candidatus Pacebacteria bacterium]|nr:30S ribosomal protein S4 [Candidatus Paceibacterota bacterium]
MARITSPQCKQCRREGKKLFLKGERCYSVKCGIARRAYAPGQHGQDRRMRVSEYCMQLREKQKLKRIYGLMEKQFRKYYDEATRMKGNTGSLLVVTLERRLDNVIYRTGLGSSRRLARQLVNHGHFKVNGTRVNIPSFMVKEGDVITVKKETSTYFKNVRETLGGGQIPSWINFDEKKLEVKINAMPSEKEAELDVNINQVVEYYSKI